MIGIGAGVVAGAAIWLLRNENNSLRDAIAVQKATIASYEAAQSNNLLRIRELTILNNTCVDERRVDEQQNASTVARLQADLEALRTRPPKIVREEIYRDPSCAELGRLDIAAACPALADGLRERARSLSDSR